MDENSYVVGKRIKELREHKFLSQAELAKRMGYKSKSTITRIENGTVHLSARRLYQIADILEADPRYILGETDDNQVQLKLFKGTYNSVDTENNDTFEAAIKKLYDAGKRNFDVQLTLETFSDCLDKLRIRDFSEIQEYIRKKAEM